MRITTDDFDTTVIKMFVPPTLNIFTERSKKTLCKERGELCFVTQNNLAYFSEKFFLCFPNIRNVHALIQATEQGSSNKDWKSRNDKDILVPKPGCQINCARNVLSRYSKVVSILRTVVLILWPFFSTKSFFTNKLSRKKWHKRLLNVITNFLRIINLRQKLEVTYFTSPRYFEKIHCKPYIKPIINSVWLYHSLTNN